MSNLYTRRRVLGAGLAAVPAIVLPTMAVEAFGKGWCRTDPTIILDGQRVQIVASVYATGPEHVTSAKYYFFYTLGHTMIRDPNDTAPCDFIGPSWGNQNAVRFVFTSNDGSYQGRLEVTPLDAGPVQAAVIEFNGTQYQYSLL